MSVRADKGVSALIAWYSGIYPLRQARIDALISFA